MDDFLVIEPADPRSAEAADLIGQLSAELARRYDFIDDGAGHFQPENALVSGSAFLVGRIAGQPIACGAVVPLQGDVAEIKRVFVAPAWRGRGHARSLVAELERQARRLGYAIVRLETGDRQPEAIRLYERAGYRRIPRFGIYVDSAWSVCFEKRLSAEPGPANGGAP